MYKIHCLIPCAGNSARFSTNKAIEKKQFFLLKGIPLFIYTLRTFSKLKDRYISSKMILLYLLYHKDDLEKITFF